VGVKEGNGVWCYPIEKGDGLMYVSQGIEGVGMEEGAIQWKGILWLGRKSGGK
jgi:hypothetical protein